MEVGGEGEKGEELDKEEMGGEEEFETEDMGREWKIWEGSGRGGRWGRGERKMGWGVRRE